MISLERFRLGKFSEQGHTILALDAFLSHPDETIERACLQKFANITPQYPGIRAPLEDEVAVAWVDALSPLLSRSFDEPDGRWSMQAWYSIVTRAPQELAPIQCLPHVDGTDPRQIAFMLYLHRTSHGGTAFFRHLATGLEDLSEATYPRYKAALEAGVARSGLPPRAYVTDGAPHFARTYATPGIFNQAVLYRGNILHSGVIDNDAALSADPRVGRLTINGFLRPPGA